MNAQHVLTALDYGANYGNTLSNEQCVVVQTSLIILQNENHFVQILGALRCLKGQSLLLQVPVSHSYLCLEII